jgi:hypothetical protein
MATQRNEKNSAPSQATASKRHHAFAIGGLLSRPTLLRLPRPPRRVYETAGEGRRAGEQPRRNRRDQCPHGGAITAPSGDPDLPGVHPVGLVLTAGTETPPLFGVAAKEGGGTHGGHHAHHADPAAIIRVRRRRRQTVHRFPPPGVRDRHVGRVGGWRARPPDRRRAGHAPRRGRHPRGREEAPPAPRE